MTIERLLNIHPKNMSIERVKKNFLTGFNVQTKYQRRYYFQAMDILRRNVISKGFELYNFYYYENDIVQLIDINQSSDGCYGAIKYKNGGSIKDDIPIQLLEFIVK